MLEQKYSFEKILISSKRKPYLIKSDRGKVSYNSIFQSFLNNNNIKQYSGYSSFGSVFAERYNRTIRDLLKRPVFGKCESNWIDILPTITKQCKNRIHSSTKLSPNYASLRKNKGYFYKNLLDKQKKISPKFKIHYLARTADLKRTFSKRDTTKWSYKLYKITEIIIDTMPTYHIDILPERYNEALLERTQLTMKESNIVMEKLNIS